MFTVDKRAGCLEIGATFLSTLAYGHDKRRCDRFAGALIVQCVFKALDDRRYNVVPEALRLVCLIDRAKLEKNANSIVSAGLRVIDNERLVAARQARPFRFGTAYGAVLGCLAACAIPTQV
jgi:hypothetical protein